MELNDSEERLLRFVRRRFGRLKGDQQEPLDDGDDVDGDPTAFLIGVKPPAHRVVRSYVREKRGLDEVDRQFGVGTLGDMTMREVDEDVIRRRPNLRRQLMNITDHRPYFTYWVTSVQVLVIIFSFIFYGIGPLGVGLNQSTELIMTKWLTMEQVNVFEPSNTWIGPHVSGLIKMGAKYTPCMRPDQHIHRKIRDDQIRETNSTGCCIRNDNSGCVQTDEESCSKVLSTFVKWSESSPGPGSRISGPVCGSDPRFCDRPGPFAWPDDISKWPLCHQWSSGSIGAPRHLTCRVHARPCCIGIHGRCEMRSREYCEWAGGVYHQDATLCSQVQCMQDVCAMLPFATGAPDQIYRLWTSLFLHAGVIHSLFTFAFQLVLMRDVERLCGTTLTAGIYFAAGITGNLVSAIFVPYRAECGPSGALFGMMGVLVAEVLRAWPILYSPRRALLELVGVVVFFFLCGLLPWVDNYAHVSGFVVGLAIAYFTIPSLEHENADLKKWYPWIAFSVTLLALSVLLALFYLAPIYDCEFCNWFSCIPFTKDFCAEQYVDYVTKKHLF